jgi:ABC-2 type transport system ATP-binding protein
MTSRNALASEPPARAVEIKGLTKFYGGNGRGKPALDHIDLTIPRGVIFGLLGPNGAGKSTLINILAGLVIKTAGSARIWGIDIDEDPRNARAAIGVVPQELNLDSFFAPRELLDVQAGLYGVPKSERRTGELLELVGLTEKADSPARTLSGGMRRRLMMAKAMVHSPPVLVLDEPTAGVDVELRQDMWNVVRELRASGVTIILTTHYIEEAEEMADRIGVINKGTLILVEEKNELMRKLGRKQLILHLQKKLDALPPALAAHNLALADGGNELVFTYDTMAERTGVTALLTDLNKAGIRFRDLHTTQSSLEDIFVGLVSERQ